MIYEIIYEGLIIYAGPSDAHYLNITRDRVKILQSFNSVISLIWQ
jgi:hypothetical protein